MVIEFIGILQIVTTVNYHSLTELRTPRITVVTTVLVFTRRCLIAAFNGGRSSSSRFPDCPQPQLPACHFSQHQLSTGYSYKTVSIVQFYKSTLLLTSHLCLDP
jgi:hypothetical protein